MPVIFPKLWSTKIPVGEQVNRGHPLANGLTFFLPVSSSSPGLTDTLSNLTSVNSGLAITPGANGLEANFPGPDVAFSFPSASQVFLPKKGEISIAQWQKTDTVTGSAASSFGLDDSDPNRCQAHCPYSDSQIYWDYGDTSASNRLSVAYPTPVTGVYYFFVFTSSVKAGNLKIYANGKLLASGGTAASTISPTGSYWIGKGASAAFTGRIAYHAIWNRELTPSEILALYANPYAFMQPQSPQRRYWVPGAATPAGPTLTLQWQGVDVR